MSNSNQQSNLNNLALQLAFNDPSAKYLAVLIDDDGTTTTTKYYGLQAKNGDWYIMQALIVSTVTTYGYCVGTNNGASGNLRANWPNRAFLVYSDPAGLFI